MGHGSIKKEQNVTDRISEDTKVHLGLEISSKLRQRLLNMQAERQLKNGERVSLSELVREALEWYLQDHEI